MYEYKCELARVVDGDTVDLFIDLGFNIKIKERFRLALIDAPESRTRDLEEKKKGIAATDFLGQTLLEAKAIKIRTDKDGKGKFGRWLGTLYVTDDEEPYAVNSWKEVNTMMVSAGHAIFKDY